MIRSIEMKRFVACAASVVALTLVGMGPESANAAIVVDLANWTFETSQPATAGPFAAELGVYAAASQALGSHAGAAVYSSPAGNGSAHSFSSNTWAVGDYYQLSTKSLNYADIKLSWDQTSSATGPKDFELYYNVNGGAYTLAGSYVVLPNQAGAPGAGAWNSTTAIPAYSYVADLSSIAALENKNAISFRLRMSTTADSTPPGTVAAAGTDRIDNFRVIATQIPLPGAAFVFVGVAAAAGVARRRLASLVG
jgi:hypothetical protein